MMRRTLGMIAAIPEFGPAWLFHHSDLYFAALEWAGIALGVRGDGRDFDDGYDRVANAAARRAHGGK